MPVNCQNIGVNARQLWNFFLQKPNRSLVDLNRRHFRVLLEHHSSEGSGTRPDLNDADTLLAVVLQGIHDLVDIVLVAQEVLTETLFRPILVTSLTT